MNRVRWIALVALWLVAPRPAGASGPSGVAGLDHYSGPDGSETRSALGLAGFAFGSGDLLGGAMWFDDGLVGAGYGVVAGGGASLGGPLSLRILATRYAAERGFRAWRLRTGPQWGLANGGTLGLFWVHDSNNLGTDTESAAGDLSFPLAPAWTGKLSGSVGRSGETTGYAASAGAAWTIVPRLEIGGELGLARHPPAAAPVPGRGILDPPLGLGQEPQPRAEDEIASTTSLSLRLSFP